MQSGQVVFISARDDVEIEGGHRSAMQNGGGSTDDDELYISLDERPKKLCDVCLIRTRHE